MRKLRFMLQRVILSAMLCAPLPLHAQNAKPTVTVIATGGTIAGRSTTPTSFQNYRAGQVPIDTMLAALRPGIDSVAELRTVQFANRASTAYTIADF